MLRRTSLTLMALLVACASPSHRITGGTKQVRISVKESDLNAALRPLLEDSPEAIDRLDALRVQLGFAWAISLFGSAVNLSALTSVSLGAADFKGHRLALILGGVGGLLVGSLISWSSSLLTPKKKDYAQVLRDYNQANPEHPYIAPTLGRLTP